MRAAEAAAYAGLFLFGVVVALLGAVLPLLSAPLGLGLDDTGNLFAALNGAILAGTLAFGAMVDRFGYRGVLTSGPLLIAVALILVSEAGSGVALGGAVALLGLGGSALNSATNTLVAELYPDPKAKAASMNRLGVAFGVGALFLPFLMGTLLDRLGLTALLRATAALAILVAAASALPRYPPPKQPEGLSVRAALALLRQPLMVVLGGILFFQAGTEMLVSGYLTTVLTIEDGASVRLASGVLAGFWIALMTARLLLGRVLLWVPALDALPIMAGGAAACLALVPLAPGLSVTATLFIGTGFLYAGTIPTVLGVAGTAHPKSTGTAFGLLLSVSVVGAMTVPWVAGHLAASVGTRVVPLLGAGCLVLVMVLSLGAGRIERRH